MIVDDEDKNCVSATAAPVGHRTTKRRLCISARGAAGLSEIRSLRPLTASTKRGYHSRRVKAC